MEWRNDHIAHRLPTTFEAVRVFADQLDDEPATVDSIHADVATSLAALCIHRLRRSSASTSRPFATPRGIVPRADRYPHREAAATCRTDTRAMAR